ncbi:T9SS type B sorting domain-containing protein [Polluticaenibacter yanchengensis]|uniref:Gliding motility-associated C-terminal domain-containing protein n=1 Tax=Polluticaenibacter yanchengensis TaxID=3014562 RepID=A0ABT4UMZ9_9BACT|nr:gliding motility-associated C-terminal domain-containing protein [Chitinophagaceae bacterium LY-5]
MWKVKICCVLYLLFSSIVVLSQGNCPVSSLGQNPSTAFPVCGSNVFEQTSVNICGGQLTPNGVCNAATSAVNPYWYRFTCYKTGTLGFLILPNSALSDYDWQIYDITNRDPEQVYTNPQWVIAANWSGNSGVTGTGASGKNVIECDNYTPNMSAMPVIEEGRSYLLLVSHFTRSQAGYKLVFNNGTALLSDTKQPNIMAAKADCNGNTITVSLNKSILCRSIAADGSDFSINTGAGKIVSASAVNCSGSFTTESVTLVLSNPVPEGNYNITIQQGSDGNTLLDVCNIPVYVGERVLVSISKSSATQIWSISPTVCKPMFIDISLTGPVKCHSIATNGSDFYISGRQAIEVVKSEPVSCSDNLTSDIRLFFNKAIQLGGNYKLGIKKGSDGNTLLNACEVESAIGLEIDYLVADTVNANIINKTGASCIAETLQLLNDGNSSINIWRWRLNNEIVSISNSYEIKNEPGVYPLSLFVSNGICADSTYLLFENKDNKITAKIEGPTEACPLGGSVFKANGNGNISQYEWDFGNGLTSDQKVSPAQNYPVLDNPAYYNIRLIVKNDVGCRDTAFHSLKISSDCYIAVPNGFTPNGDGLNDFLYPLNGYLARQLNFSVYNRFGQKVWETTSWTRKWDGTISGKPQPTGTYIWYLVYTDEAGAVIKLNGSVNLIR